MTDSSNQSFCQSCWYTFADNAMHVLGGARYCDVCYARLTEDAPEPDLATEVGEEIADVPRKKREEIVQEIVATDPVNTPKGEKVVEAGVPIGSDLNTGRNDSGRGAPSAQIASKFAPEKATAKPTLIEADIRNAGNASKSKATRQTSAGGSQTP